MHQVLKKNEKYHFREIKQEGKENRENRLWTYEKLCRILPEIGACHYYNHRISANRTESSQLDPCQPHPVLLPDKKIITMKLHLSS